MAYAAAREAGPLRLGEIYGGENFGTLDIDWWAGRVTLSVRAVNGEPMRRAVIALGAGPER